MKFLTCEEMLELVKNHGIVFVALMEEFTMNIYIYIGFTRKTIKENNPRIHQNVDTINQL